MTGPVLQAHALAVGHGRRCVAQGLDFQLQPTVLPVLMVRGLAPERLCLVHRLAHAP